MPYRSQKHDDDGAVLLYTLCVGALLVIFSAMLLRAVGLLAIGRSSRLQEEEAWQQAVTLTDRLANELVAPETEYHRFVGTTFLSDAYQNGETYSFTASPNLDGYGVITVTLRKGLARQRADEISLAPADLMEEELLAACEAFEAQAPASWKLDMTVTVETETARTQSVRHFTWTEAGQALYTVEGVAYRRETGTLMFYPAEISSSESAAEPPLSASEIDGPITVTWLPGDAADGVCAGAKQ